MASFSAIAQAKDTSLAVVAPGIAEALATTAIGLAAAIPAAIGYNRLGSAITAKADDLAGLIEERALDIVAPHPAKIVKEAA
jgi:biopolymer transport protein ExbB/TolQ